MQDPLAVAADDLPRSGGEQHPRGRRPGCAGAGQHDPHVLEPLADDAQRVEQRGEDDDRGAVLVVVEDRDRELLAQARLDLEAARRGDVLEVDPAEDGRDRGDGAHDLVRVGRRQAQRPGVDPAELLEQDRLALHHGQRRLRADVAEAEHGRAVGDDRDRVLLDGQVPDLLGVGRDRLADARDAGRVGHREVVAGLQRRLGSDLELAAEVEQERPVGDVLDLDPVSRADRLDDPLDVRLVVGEHGDVAHLLAALDPDQVDRAEQPAGLADRARQPRERSRLVVEVDAQRGAEGRGRVHSRSFGPWGAEAIRGPTERACGFTARARLRP